MRTLLILAAMNLIVWASAPLPAQELGAIPPGGFKSPEGDPRFSPESGVKPINNLVFELLNRESPGEAPYTFHNPREGWVYVRVSKPDTK